MVCACAHVFEGKGYGLSESVQGTHRYGMHTPSFHVMRRPAALVIRYVHSLVMSVVMKDGSVVSSVKMSYIY